MKRFSIEGRKTSKLEQQMRSYRKGGPSTAPEMDVFLRYYHNSRLLHETISLAS